MIDDIMIHFHTKFGKTKTTQILTDKTLETWEAETLTLYKNLETEYETIVRQHHPERLKVEMDLCEKLITLTGAMKTMSKTREDAERRLRNPTHSEKLADIATKFIETFVNEMFFEERDSDG